MKKILILCLFLLGCESFGVFSHEHEDSHEHGGVCAAYRGYENSSGPPSHYCFLDYTEYDCLQKESDYAIYDAEWAVQWYNDFTNCDEFCSNTSEECQIEN